MLRKKKDVVQGRVAVAREALGFNCGPDCEVTFKIWRGRGGRNKRRWGKANDKSGTPCDKAVVVFAMLLTDCSDKEPRVDPNDGRGDEEPRKGGYGMAGDRKDGRVSE
jgi:hypothetical protein